MLAVSGDDVYVDLGSRDGVGAGARLSLLRVVVARDPVSGQVLRDRFAVGTLTVERAGEHVALAHPEAGARRARSRLATGSPWRRCRAASSIRGRSGSPPPRRRRPAPPPAARARRSPPAGARSTRPTPRARCGGPTWASPRRRGPPAGGRYLSGRPDSPYEAAVRAEIASLDRQAAALTAARGRADAPDDAGRARQLARTLADLTPAARTRSPLAVDAPAQVLPGRPVTLAFAIVDPAAATRAWLYVRRHGAPAYQRLELVRTGDAYLRATIPADLIGPGGADWFVETARGDGPPRAAIGSEGHPRILAAAPDLTEPPIARHRSTVTATVDYVDFDGRLQRGHDQYYQAEVGFAYRFLHPVHAVRLGFGTLSGQGGPKDVIDADPTGRCLDADGVYQLQAGRLLVRLRRGRVAAEPADRADAAAPGRPPDHRPAGRPGRAVAVPHRRHRRLRLRHRLRPARPGPVRRGGRHQPPGRGRLHPGRRHDRSRPTTGGRRARSSRSRSRSRSPTSPCPRTSASASSATSAGVGWAGSIRRCASRTRRATSTTPACRAASASTSTGEGVRHAHHAPPRRLHRGRRRGRDRRSRGARPAPRRPRPRPPCPRPRPPPPRPRRCRPASSTSRRAPPRPAGRSSWSRSSTRPRPRPRSSSAGARPAPTAYHDAPFERSSAGGWYATIPAADVEPPGVEYYIAGRTTDGAEHAHFASAGGAPADRRRADCVRPARARRPGPPRRPRRLDRGRRHRPRLRQPLRPRPTTTPGPRRPGPTGSSDRCGARPSGSAR